MSTPDGELRGRAGPDRRRAALLATAATLAALAAAAVVLADDARWLRLGVVAALWAAVVAGIVVARHSRGAAGAAEAAQDAAADLAAAQDEADELLAALRRDHDLQLAREAAAREESERAAEKAREDAASLREQLERMRVDTGADAVTLQSVGMPVPPRPLQPLAPRPRGHAPAGRRRLRAPAGRTARRRPAAGPAARAPAPGRARGAGAPLRWGRGRPPRGDVETRVAAPAPGRPLADPGRPVPARHRVVRRPVRALGRVRTPRASRPRTRVPDVPTSAPAAASAPTRRPAGPPTPTPAGAPSPSSWPPTPPPAAPAGGAAGSPDPAVGRAAPGRSRYPPGW